MRITTLNLRGFHEWETRRHRVEAHLREVRPDVVLLQEVVYLPQLATRPQVDDLHSALDYRYRHSSVTRLQDSATYGDYREGLAVLTSHEVTGVESLVLRREDDDPHDRIVQLIDLRVDGAAVQLANVHFSVQDVHAVEHLDELLDLLDTRGERRIIGGDFNIDIAGLAEEAPRWKADYVLTAERQDYVTFPASGEAIDHFLVPRDFSFGRVVLSGDDISDHRAVTVDVTRR